jgi:replicative DNA helicase
LKILHDSAAENALLAGLIKYGNDGYVDISGIVSENTFTVGFNAAIYKCIRKLLEEDSDRKIDTPSIFSAAKELGLEYIFKKSEQVTHLNSLLSIPVAKSNLEKFAKKLRKFEVVRLYVEQLQTAKDKLMTITGEEAISQILSIPEEAVFNFQSLLNDEDDGPILLFDDVKEHIHGLIHNPQDQIGISSGLPHLDAAIGGGLRGSTVNIIAARPKVGKSICAGHIATYIARHLNIPTLNLDTEMQKSDQMNRSLAMLTGVDVSDIETGKFGRNSYKLAKISEITKSLPNVPYYYKSIAGMSFEDQLSLMRRWILKNVGLRPDGKANRCVIIYDYLKLMDAKGISNDMKEYQLLGFMITSLHNFTVKYDIPIVAFMQLNRDGIDKEDTSAASMSDRIIWLCSNFSILKKKTDEEMAEDGPMLGNRKLVPIVCRHGPGLNFGEYICLNFEGRCMKLTELGTNTSLKKNSSSSEDDSDDNVEF